MKNILTPDKLFSIAISDDRLTATLDLANVNSIPPANREGIINGLKELKICYDQQQINTILEPFIASLTAKEKPEPVIVARGVAVKNETPGVIVKVYELAHNERLADPEAERQSHYDLSDIITAKQGEPLLKLEQPQPGSDGFDVFGSVIAHKKGKEVKVKLGASVHQQGDTIYGEIDGKVNFNGNTISVEKYLEINGDVDFSVGNIDFDGDVEIRKNVLDLFQVYASGDLIIRGIVEAADVVCDKDIYALGGISCKEKGSVICKGNLQAKYITNSNVKVAGKIDTTGEIINSLIACGGQLTAKSSEITGGKYNIKGGLVCKELGSISEVKTLVEIGYDRDLEAKAKELLPQIRSLHNKAERVRAAVEPLLANAKHLNSEQKEKATELLYNTYELDEKRDALCKELKECYDEANEKCVEEILVFSKIYPGVKIRFPRVQAVVKREIDGPVRIIPEKIRKNAYRIVAVFQGSDKVIPLASQSSPEECWEQLEELMAELQPQPQKT